MAQLRKVVLIGSLAALAVAALDGGLAAWAQAAGVAEAARLGITLERYSLPGHVLAMAALALVTVAAGVELVRRGGRVPAGLVAVGVAAGPMAVVAVPVHRSLVASEADTAAWWHLAVGLPQLAIMLGATWAAARLVPADRGALTRRDLAGFALVAAAAATLQLLTSEGITEEPQPAVVLGWSLLGAALTVLARHGAWRPAMAAVAPLGLMYLAYWRPGGWPGAAGWELFAQSPVVLDWTTPVVLLTGPVVVAVGRVARLALPRAAARA